MTNQALSSINMGEMIEQGGGTQRIYRLTWLNPSMANYKQKYFGKVGHLKNAVKNRRRYDRETSGYKYPKQGEDFIVESAIVLLVDEQFQEVDFDAL